MDKCRRSNNKDFNTPTRLELDIWSMDKYECPYNKSMIDYNIWIWDLGLAQCWIQILMTNLAISVVDIGSQHIILGHSLQTIMSWVLVIKTFYPKLIEELSVVFKDQGSCSSWITQELLIPY